jgi:pyruvate/2-oxoglutarate/acetoin dehydrogenase E1 component
MAAITYLEAIRQGLQEEMRRDPAVFLLGEDVGAYGGAFKLTEGLLDEFGPERVIDTPLAEQAMVGAAIGAALVGMRPVVEFQFIDFMACAWNLITNFAAKDRYRWGAGTPLVLRGPAGGGTHGGPFHSASPEMYYVHTPGLKVVAPGTAYDAKGLMKAAIRDEDPVICLEHKYLYRRIKEEVPPGDYVVPIGKAATRRQGDDLTVFTYGAMLHVVLEAAQLLADEDGTEIEVVDLRSLLPLDEEAILEGTRKTGKVLVVHEDTRTGGIAGEVMAMINEGAWEHLDAPPQRLTAPDTPFPYSPTMEAFYLPSARDVVDACRQLAAY